MKILAKYKTFTKYLVSYAIVLLIPLIILSAIMYNSFTQLLKDEANKSSNEMLLSVKDSIDSRIEELNKIAIQISSNSYLKSYSISSEDSNFIKVISTLSNISFPNNFYSECFLYYYGDNLIYSSKGTYRTDQFINNIYMYKNWSNDDFYKDIKNINKYLVRPAEPINVIGAGDTSKNYITYVLPIPYGSINNNGVVMFMIEESKFKKLLIDVAQLQNGSAFILDEKLNLLAGYGTEYDRFKDIIKLIQVNHEIVSEKIKLNNKDYLLASCKSKVTGWTYISLIPISSIINKLEPLKIKAIIGIGFVLLLGCGLVVLLTKINYKPIKKLIDFFDDSFEDNNGGEIESVVKAVENMDKTINILQDKVKNSKPNLKKEILVELVRGHYNTIKDFNLKASEVGISFSKKLYCVAVFIFLNSEKNYDLVEIIESEFKNDYEGYGFESVNRKQARFVICYDDSSNEGLKEKIYQIQLNLMNKYNIMSTVCVGNSYESTSEIGNSYVQVSSLIDYRSIKDENNIIFYRDLHFRNYDELNLRKKIQKLEAYVIQGEKDKVIDLINEMFLDIKNKDIPIFLVRSFCYNLINTILDAAYKESIKDNLRKYKYFDIVSLVRFETMEELKEQINDICLYVCSLVEEHRTKINNSKPQELIDYINNNCFNSNFSLNIMADQFNMSVSNISYYFKTYIHHNISDYINELRIERAKKLLVETDINVQDIVLKIGYLNVSSFIRKFKQITGVTPGKYREIYKKGA